MIILQKLEWDWMFSYGKGNVLDFTSDVVTQILGLNGMGKSSIPLIIEELLFNKNSKGIKKSDIPNRYVKKGYWGRLTFTKDDDKFSVEVDRKSSIKIKLHKNGEDISSHTATNTFKMIEEILGLDFKTFSQLVYQNTNTSLQFLVATDTNRKKFLIDLLQLEEYVRLFDIFKEAVKQHSTTVTSIQSQLSTIEKWLAQNKLEDTQLRVPLDTENGYDIGEDERISARLSTEISNIDKTNRSINKNNQYKQLLAAINIDEINAIEADPTISYDLEQSELGGLNADKSRISTYITKLRKLGDSCPTCEQDIDSSFKNQLIEKEEHELHSIENKIHEITRIIDGIKSNNSRYKSKQEGIKEWQELFAAVNRTLPSQTINKEELVDELTNIGIRISNTKAKLKEINSYNQDVARHNSRVNVFIEQSEKFEKELEELQTRLNEESNTLATLELLKKSFSTNGLVAYKIENLVKDLEELTNDYLAELSDGRFTIEFSVVSDKLNVNITDNSNSVDILALSSGELARVNTATLLALRRLMSSISKSKINILFLDEVINVLDEGGREKLVEVLLHEDLNTYIVSHGYTHPLLHRLEIIKEDNISRILYE